MDHTAVDPRDYRMMEHCIELSKDAGSQGEYPFASVICIDDRIVVEATNEVERDGDVTRHSDLVAISAAQRALGRRNLDDCTIYTLGEPCALCAYAIRESRIRKVVYGMRSPLMGGVSRWNILTDAEISDAMPEVFAPPPLIVAGLLRDKAEAVWMHWNPVVWSAVRMRGFFGGDPTEQPPPPHATRLERCWRRIVSLFR
jgi:tRNA(adenine34) deaminase